MTSPEMATEMTKWRGLVVCPSYNHGSGLIFLMVWCLLCHVQSYLLVTRLIITRYCVLLGNDTRQIQLAQYANKRHPIPRPWRWSLECRLLVCGENDRVIRRLHMQNCTQYSCQGHPFCKAIMIMITCLSYIGVWHKHRVQSQLTLCPTWNQCFRCKR